MKMCAAPYAAAAKRAFWACVTSSPYSSAKPAATALKLTKVTNSYRPPPRKKAPAWLLLIILTMGIVALWHGLALNKKNIETKKWPSAPGKIISAKITQNEGAGKYQRKIQYEYAVGGRTYVSNRVAIGEMEVSYSEARRDVEKIYPAGREVQVYYDPLNPQDAVLRPGEFRGARFAVFLGILMIIIPLAGIFLPLREE